MSNLLTNGDFLQPTITTNTYKYYSSNMTTTEQTSFYWTVDNSAYGTYIALQNGSTAFGFANPSSISTTQFISFQYYSSIKQSVNVTIPGYYKLRFNYTCRPGYLINPLKVYINNELIYTLTRYTNTWDSAYVLYNATKAGTYTIQLLTDFMDNDTTIAITNVVFFRSLNVLNNAWFYTPTIFENTYVNVNNFYSPEMYSQFYWSYNNGTTGSITLANGLTDFDNSGFSSIDARIIQHVIIKDNASIYQNVYCPVTGSYLIYFFLNSSVNSTLNYIKFYIDNTLVYTLPTSTITQWTFYNFSTNISEGYHEFKILGASGLIAIGNVELMTPSTYSPPQPAPTGPTTVSNNSFKSTKVFGNFDVRPLVDISSNIITEGISTLVPKGNTTSLFIGDNNFYDTSTSYGTLSVTRNSSKEGNHQSRPHIGLIRRGRTVFQMGYCEKFTGYEDSFGLFHGFNWTLNYANPSITFSNSLPSLIGINNVAPTAQLDVSGNVLFRNNLIINRQFDLLGSALFRNNISISGTIYNIQKTNNCALFLGDNNVWDQSPDYGTLSITRPNANTGNNMTRSHIACIREGNTAFQMGYCERFTGYENNFGFFHNASYRVGGQPGITFGRDTNYIGINKVNPLTNLDVSGSAIIGVTKYGELKSVTISGTTVLSFPLNENIFCNCATGAITLKLPNTSSLTATATCTINIRRVSTQTNYISLQSYDATSLHLVNSANATAVSLISSIANANIRIQLYNNLYYVSSYA